MSKLLHLPGFRVCSVYHSMTTKYTYTALILLMLKQLKDEICPHRFSLIKKQNLHTDVACKADVRTSMRFTHHSYDCNLQ